jgi:hypothetical protein
MRQKMVTAAAMLAVIASGAVFPRTALAQPRGGRAHNVVFVGGYFYDPFFGPYPWWGPAAYPYPYFPIYDNRASVRVMVTPKEAAVYVDGYYAGVVDDFDGVLQSLPLSPGGHDIAVYLDGYRTVHQRMYLTPNKSYRIRYTMQRLGAGEKSDVPEAAPPVPPPPPGSASLPRTPRAGGPPLELYQPPAAGGAPATGYGTLAIRVQPSDADVTIDGERWTASQPGERVTVQVPEGRHHVDIRKPGFRSYSADVSVPRGETIPVNVSLSSQ